MHIKSGDDYTCDLRHVRRQTDRQTQTDRLNHNASLPGAK